MKWHLLAHDGTILRTCQADDRATAMRILGAGPVVSAISYRMDRTYIAPVERLPTTPTEPPQDYLTTDQIARHLGLSRHQIRRYATLLGLTPLILTIGNTRRAFWSPSQMTRIRRRDTARPLTTQPGLAIAKRRTAYLETIRQRYLDRGQRRRSVQCSVPSSSD